MRLGPLALVLLLVTPALAGCTFGGEKDARAGLVPYPRMGDVAVYQASGALVDFSRWENAHPFLADARVRFEVIESEKMLDGARAVHNAFEVRVGVAEVGPFVEHARRFVSPEFQGVVQAYYKLSQDQGVLAFDERGYPWLFGASPLFGEELREGGAIRVPLPDNLGRGVQLDHQWVVEGTEEVDGVETFRLRLDGPGGMRGTLWMEPGVAWPLKVRLALDDETLAPHVRADAALPATMEARRVELTPGQEPVPPRNRGAEWQQDASVRRERWDGEKPPDGEPGYVPYLLVDAVRDAKLLDAGFVQWLDGASDPRLYRATFKQVPFGTDPTGPVQGTRGAYWLIQFVDKDERYYEVQVERADVEAVGTGAPRVLSSGPAQAPGDENHGWFARSDVEERLVPLSEGVRVLREVFGATQVEIFLRSFVDPPGYSYFLDGGFEPGGVGRYTMVYNPSTGFIEQATGPVTPRAVA